MGGECIRGCSEQTTRSISWPEMRPYNDLTSQETLTFEFRIDKLRLTTKLKDFGCIRFQIDNDLSMVFDIGDFIPEEIFLSCRKTLVSKLTVPAAELVRKRLNVTLKDTKNATIKTLSLKLLQLCTGPNHQDHLLKDLNTRLMFDLHIDQTIQVKVACEELSLSLHHPDDLQSFSYSLAILGANDEHFKQSEHAYLTNGSYPRREIQTEIQSKHLKIAGMRISLTRMISSTCEIEELKPIYLPCEKLQSCSYERVQHGENITQKRVICLDEKIERDGKVLGQLRFTIILQTSLMYVEQMQGLILSESGIRTLRVDLHSESNEKQKLLDSILIKLTQIQRITSFKAEEVHEKLRQLKDLLDINRKHSFQSLTDTSNLPACQNSLIDVACKLIGQLSPGEDAINQRVWQNILEIISKKELSLRSLMSAGSPAVRRKLALNYYRMVCQTLSQIMEFTLEGVSVHELQCIHRFIAFTFFRLPWLRKQIIKVLARPTDTIISSQKLIELGASRGLLSPSKSFLFDWEATLFQQISRSKEYLEMIKSLEAVAARCQDWDELLFTRDDEDLFYGLYTAIWTEAIQVLSHEKKVLWEYFPCYGQLLGVFLGKISSSRILDYSKEFQECSLLLVSNQRLLNTFMQLLFPKTCLYETACVTRCLDLLRGYFKQITLQKKRLPQDFHLHYFSTGVKCILDCGHYYLVLKVLTILFENFSVFPLDFKKRLISFTIGKHFHSLYLHWCSTVRKMFYIFLESRVLAVSMETNPEDSHRKRSGHQMDNEHIRQLKLRIQMLKNERVSPQRINHSDEYYKRMKLKLASKKRSKQNFIDSFRLQSSTHQSYIPPRYLPSLEDLGTNLPLEKSVSDMDNQFAQTMLNFPIKHRRYSCNDGFDIVVLPEKLKRYIPIALKEHEEIKLKFDKLTDVLPEEITKLIGKVVNIDG